VPRFAPTVDGRAGGVAQDRGRCRRRRAEVVGQFGVRGKRADLGSAEAVDRAGFDADLDPLDPRGNGQGRDVRGFAPVQRDLHHGGEMPELIERADKSGVIGARRGDDVLRVRGASSSP
jgi:hypothetical protein